MSEASQVRIIIVDDQGMVRYGLGVFLGTVTGFEVIGFAQDGKQAISMAEELQPDVVLIDLMMPGITGVDAIKQISEKNPAIKIIVLTALNDTHELVKEALGSGAVCYLNKLTPVHTLATTIQEVIDGD